MGMAGSAGHCLPHKCGVQLWPMLGPGSRAQLCVQVGDTDAAFRRYREMRLRDVRPDVSTFGSLLHACAQAGPMLPCTLQHELIPMSSWGPLSVIMPAAESCSPIWPILTTHVDQLILHRLQVGNDASAARVMELLRSAGFAPSVQAYTSFIDACVKANTATSLTRAFQVRCAMPSCAPSILYSKSATIFCAQ